MTVCSFSIVGKLKIPTQQEKHACQRRFFVKHNVRPYINPVNYYWHYCRLTIYVRSYEAGQDNT